MVSANSVSGPACCKAEGVDKSSTIQQIGSASSPASKPDSVTYACDIDGVQEHVDHLPPLNADQFYRAGIAAINFLSDLAYYKFPLSNGMDILSYS